MTALVITIDANWCAVVVTALGLAARFLPERRRVRPARLRVALAKTRGRA